MVKNRDDLISFTMNLYEEMKHLLYSGYVRVDSLFAAFHLKKWSKKMAGQKRPIRVGFIAQMPEVWDKEAPVYEAMRDSEDFDVKLIVIPNWSLAANDFCDPGKNTYFFTKYTEAIDGYQNKNWLDLKSLSLDYVFYQRCYEKYLPKQYRTKEVIKYARTCYIPYYYSGIIDEDSYYKTPFFNNLYLFFCSSEEQKESINRINTSKVVYLGYPALERLGNTEQNIKNPVVLWTPRWTNDKKYGGTNFFNYYKMIPTLVRDFPGISLILRPHPLTFENAIREGRMTEDDVKRYKKDMDDLGVIFDQNELIEDTFEKTDILITDYTSAMIHFCKTEKPIIYCSEMCLNYSSGFKEIIDCSYKASCWNDVRKFISWILSEYDPLKEKRETIAEKYKKIDTNASASILEYIQKDFYLQKD